VKSSQGENIRVKSRRKVNELDLGLDLRLRTSHTSKASSLRRSRDLISLDSVRKWILSCILME
jgi:hypothetical protein